MIIIIINQGWFNQKVVSMMHLIFQKILWKLLNIRQIWINSNNNILLKKKKSKTKIKAKTLIVDRGRIKLLIIKSSLIVSMKVNNSR